MNVRSVSAAALALALGAAACSSGSSGGSGASVVDSGAAWSPDGADKDTWVSWGASFFATYCIECHNASDPKGLNFGDQKIVAANRDAIRCGVAVAQQPAWSCPSNPPAKQFPISDSSGSNPRPTDAERDRVVAWIGLGCP